MSENELNEKTKLELFFYKILEKKRLLSALIIILVVILASLFLMNEKNKNFQQEVSEKYYEAKILIENNENKEGLILLEEIISKNNQTYSPLALYLIVDKDLIKDKKKTLKLFDKILSIKKINKKNLDLIKIKKALLLSNLGEEIELLDLLNPIINSESIWKNSAAKILGDYFLYKGEKIKSKNYYKMMEN